MILVTGAGGKTGQHIVRMLALRSQKVRALVHKNEQIEKLKSLGADEVIVGDMNDKTVLQAAFAGVDSVYHIPPNANPNELTLGQTAIAAGMDAGIRHFVYHSVLHPQVEDMPHHWLKMRVEEALLKSGLDFTILQPTIYMQNLLGYREAIIEQGLYAMPYSIDTHLSMVDLSDVAEAAACVLTEPGHKNAIYELAGEDAPSPREIAQQLSELSGRPVRAEQLDRKAWEIRSRASGMNDHAVSTLQKMFEYYERYQFFGNSNVLTWLLGRAPGRFEAFLAREFTSNRG